MNNQDQILANSSQRDDVFDKEILPHVDQLYSFGYWLTKDSEAAKDLMQETLIKAFKYISYYEEGTNSKSWLFRIMKNLFLNEVQKQSRTPNLVDVQDLKVTLGSSSYAITGVTDNGFSDEVVRALDSLPENLKAVFLLKYLNDFKYHEIAEMFSIPLGTVKIWLYRAKKLLKQSMVEQKVAA